MKNIILRILTNVSKNIEVYNNILSFNNKFEINIMLDIIFGIQVS